MDPNYQNAMGSSDEDSYTQEFHGERRQKTATSSLLINTVSQEIELREDVCGIKNVSMASSRNGAAASSSVPQHPQEHYSPPPTKLSKEEQAEANRKKSSEYRKNKAIEYKNKENKKSKLTKIFYDNKVEIKKFEEYLQTNNNDENGKHMITDMEEDQIFEHYIKNIFSEDSDEPGSLRSQDDHTGDDNVPTTSTLFTRQET
nr:uncharacterized protein LOC128686043 [Cherax quadricarinatus]